MGKTTITHISFLIIALSGILLLSSCEPCKGNEPYESFDFRLIDTNGNNVVGDNMSIAPDQIALTLDGQNLVNGFYIHPQQGVIFIFDYGQLSNGENSGKLQASSDEMPIVISINKLSNSCFEYNRVINLKVDGQEYAVDDVIDFVK